MKKFLFRLVMFVSVSLLGVSYTYGQNLDNQVIKKFIHPLDLKTLKDPAVSNYLKTVLINESVRKQVQNVENIINQNLLLQTTSTTSSALPVGANSTLMSSTTSATQQQISDKIYGGKFASDNQFPWQVALFYNFNGIGPTQFCGGTLIDKAWVLTAAHCLVRYKDLDKLTILTGTNNLKSGGVRHQVKKVYVHEAYSENTKDNDIALIELAEIAEQTPISLATQTDASAYMNATTMGTIAGWGITQNGFPSDDLLFAAVPFVPNTVCNAVESYNNKITDNMLCAGRKEGRWR
jgi:secreted trypsin-like serine protease